MNQYGAEISSIPIFSWSVLNSYFQKRKFYHWINKPKVAFSYLFFPFFQDLSRLTYQNVSEDLAQKERPEVTKIIKMLL